jgi:hypothetical protein
MLAFSSPREGAATVFEDGTTSAWYIAIPQKQCYAKLCRVACLEPWRDGSCIIPGSVEGVSALRRLHFCLSGLGVRNTTRQASAICMFMLLRRFAVSSATTQPRLCRVPKYGKGRRASVSLESKCMSLMCSSSTSVAKSPSSRFRRYRESFPEKTYPLVDNATQSDVRRLRPHPC